METEEEKKKRLEEQAEEMKRRWAANAPEIQKGFLGQGEEGKKSQWARLFEMFGG
jgi:hypothetical protein